MSDQGIKQIRIKQSDLPALLVNDQGYALKYRVVSDDKNLSSHWSPIINIVPDYIFTSGVIEFNKAGNIATLVWEPVSIYKDSVFVRQATEYDVWVRWDRNDGGDWIYKERTQTTSLSLPVPTTYTINNVIQGSAPNKLSVEVFLKGTPITRDSSFLLVYQDGPHTV